MIRVAVAPADSTACGYYRMTQPYSRLSACDGFDVRFLAGGRDAFVAEADVLVMQRVTTPRALVYMQGARAQLRANIVMDMDDHLHALPPSNPLYSSYRTGTQSVKILERAFELCDAWTVATQRLGQERQYRKSVARVEVIRNALDDDAFTDFERRFPSDLAAMPRRQGQIRIGWAGSATHTADLLSVIPALCEVLLSDERVTFVLFGYPNANEITRHFGPLASRVEDFGFLPSPPQVTSETRVHIADAARAFILGYYERLAQMQVDVMVAPLVSTTFTACKSDLKILESTLAGYPVVASRTGPYREYASEADDLVLTAVDTREWVGALRSLVSDGPKRAALVAANRQHVRTHHLASHRTPIYGRIMKSLAVRESVATL